jgi:hypothetical protein
MLFDPMPVNGEEKWACNLCGEPKYTHVRARFVCPVHGLNVEVGPQPDGVPKRHPCPGGPDPEIDGHHDIWPIGVTCVQHYGWDEWQDPGPER